MYIDHIALWTKNLEEMKAFYCKYFGGISNSGYHNHVRGFRSYFIHFDKGSRIELMNLENLTDGNSPDSCTGYTHIAMAVPTEEEVDTLTRRIETDGFTVAGNPRRTGDGYYESIVLDPDGNRVEIVAAK